MIIKIEDLQLQCSIGVYEAEKLAKRNILVCFEIEVNYENILDKNTDNIETVLDYDKIVKTAAQIASVKHYNLLETLCAALGAGILQLSPFVKLCTIEIKKPYAILTAKMVSIKHAFSAVNS